VVSKQTKKQQAKAAKDAETEGARSPIRVPPQDSRTPTLTQAQIRKNAREGLKETYGSKSRKGRPRGGKSKGNDPGGSSSKRGRSTSSNGAGAPRKRPDTREKSCARDDPGLKTGSTIVWTEAQGPCMNAVTLKKEQKVIHLRFHHQPFMLILKCPACEEQLPADLATNMRKHVATHANLTGAVLLKKHIWDF
jgi:hypothetical protein